MRKKEELSNPNSCINRALEDEQTFVLLARDAVAAATIEMWCHMRIEEGLNKPNDKQIQEAYATANSMRNEFTIIRKRMAMTK